MGHFCLGVLARTRSVRSGQGQQEEQARGREFYS